MLNKVKWFFISNLNTSYNFIYDKNVVGKAPKFAESLTRDKFLDLLVNLYSLAQADYVVYVHLHPIYADMYMSWCKVKLRMMIEK